MLKLWETHQRKGTTVEPEARDIQKSFVAKAEATGTPGEFVALVSVFGNLDSQGDIVDKGAFAGAIEKFAGEKNMPVIWSHQWHDVNAYLGTYTKMEETDEGLKLTGILDVDDSPAAARVYQLMKNRRIDEFSFGGRVTKTEIVRAPAGDGEDERTEYHLKEIDLWEAGPTFKGANNQTQLLSVKSLDNLPGVVATKEGRVLAQKHTDALKSVHQTLGEVIDAVAPKDDPAKTITPETDDVVKSTTLSPGVQALLVLSQLDNIGRATS